MFRNLSSSDRDLLEQQATLPSSFNPSFFCHTEFYFSFNDSNWIIIISKSSILDLALFDTKCKSTIILTFQIKLS